VDIEGLTDINQKEIVMRKVEFMVGIILRFATLAYSIDELVQAGDWGFIWQGIFYFVLAVTMIASIASQVIMLVRWKPQEKEYYQF